MDEFSSNIGVGKTFLTMTQNIGTIKEKIDKSDCLKK